MLILPDLVLETVIRDGLELVRRKPEMLERIFGTLTNDNLQMKYGEAEINRIKEWIENKEIAVVQAFSQVTTNMPCVSIQLLAEDEDIPLATLDDYSGQEEETFDECGEETPIVIPSLTASSFDAVDSRLNFADGVDLSAIHPNLIVRDIDGNDFIVLSPISEEAGDQFITIDYDASDPEQTPPNITQPLEVISSINSHIYELNSTREQSRLLLGIHTEERLTTVYLFNLIKWVILARKADLEANCLELSTYNASDFTRNEAFAGDIVFSRYMTFKSMLEHEWRADEIDQIDWAEVVAEVQNNEDLAEATGQAYCNNEHLDLDDKTIRIKESNEDE